MAISTLKFENLEELEYFINSLKLLGVGSEGSCYQLNYNQVLKYLDGPDYKPKSKEELLQFQYNKNKSYLFANGLAFMKEEIVGVIMPLGKGMNFNEQDISKIKFKELTVGIKEFEESTQDLSNDGIHVSDVFETNLLYKRGTIQAIDTLEYFLVNIEQKKLYDENIKAFCQVLNDLLFQMPSIKRVIYDTKILKQMYSREEYLYQPFLFMKFLYEELLERSDGTIKTVGQVKQLQMQKKIY